MKNTMLRRAVAPDLEPPMYCKCGARHVDFDGHYRCPADTWRTEPDPLDRAWVVRWLRAEGLEDAARSIELNTFILGASDEHGLTIKQRMELRFTAEMLAQRQAHFAATTGGPQDDGKYPAHGEQHPPAPWSLVKSSDAPMISRPWPGGPMFAGVSYKGWLTCFVGDATRPVGVPPEAAQWLLAQTGGRDPRPPVEPSDPCDHAIDQGDLCRHGEDRKAGL